MYPSSLNFMMKLAYSLNLAIADLTCEIRRLGGYPITVPSPQPQETARKTCSGPAAYRCVADPGDVPGYQQRLGIALQPLPCSLPHRGHRPATPAHLQLLCHRLPRFLVNPLPSAYIPLWLRPSDPDLEAG